MATNTASSGNISDPANWSLGHVPIAGEDVVIPTGQTMPWDGANGTTTLPATGAFNSLTFQGSGQITLALDVVGNCVLNAGTWTSAGQVSLLVSGTTTNTLAVTVTSGTAGTSSGCHAIRNNGTGPVTITGPITGSAQAAAKFYYNNSTAAVTVVNSTITGGAGPGACGVDYGAGTLTLTNCSLVNHATPGGGTAISGVKSPTWTPDTNTTITYGGVVLGKRPTAGEMLPGTTCGGVAGTAPRISLVGAGGLAG
jgi:hypothetical protein